MEKTSIERMDECVPPEQYKAGYDRLARLITQGKQQEEAIINQVTKMVIKDYLINPSRMEFSTTKPGAKVKPEVRVSIPSPSFVEPLQIHRHAYRQMAGKINFPILYGDNLLTNDEDSEWKAELLTSNLNTHYQKSTFKDRSGDPRVLFRVVGNEVRGFLSRRFNRHIASGPLLKAFLEACHEVQLIPTQATCSPIKLSLKTIIPYVFEAAPGIHVCLGLNWTNSDFGAGRMTISSTLWSPTTGGFTVLDHVLSRVHIGSVMEDSDMEVSEETARKEIIAQRSAIKDAVIGQLSTPNVRRILKAIQVASEEEVPWYRLKGQLAKLLAKGDVDRLKDCVDNGVMELPPVRVVDGQPVLSKWWAVSAIGWLSERTEDPEKKLDLQAASGSFLDVFIKNDDTEG